MNAQTERAQLAGPAGALELAIDHPASAPIGTALVLHPLPTHGGTMDNKVVQTLARACVQLGYRTLRFNFRGVGASQGSFDGGPGEIADALAVVQAQRVAGEPFVLAGFSFGAFVATKVAEQVGVDRLALVGLAASRFPATTVPAETLVVHGELDDVVPLSAVLDWARPQALPVTVVPGAGHFFHGQLPLLKRLLVQAWSS